MGCATHNGSGSYFSWLVGRDSGMFKLPHISTTRWGDIIFNQSSILICTILGGGGGGCRWPLQLTDTCSIANKKRPVYTTLLREQKTVEAARARRIIKMFRSPPYSTHVSPNCLQVFTNP